VALVSRRQDEVREHLAHADLQPGCLLVAEIDRHVVLALQLRLEQPDDPVVLELLSDRPYQNRTQVTSGEPGIVTHLPDPSIELPSRALARQLDADLFWLQNDAVIAAAESSLAESATKTILIVDDDRSVADTFARMLKLEGFEVATAINAEAGLELAENVRPSAIILDMRMPITNGLQFLRMVRAKPHLLEVPVAIVTGDYFLSDPIQHELKSLGASIRFKPLWLEDLIALAKTLVA
jgi:CheY-like chemotaxis protein